MDQSNYKEFLKKLEDPDITPATKDLIRKTIEKTMTDGYDAAYNELLKVRARNDLAAYTEYVYGYKPTPHQKEIIKVLEDESKKRVLIIASPGSAKSTLVSQIYPTYFIGKNPEYASFLLSSSSEQSVKFSSDIRSVIEANERYREVFPEIEIDEIKGSSRDKFYVKRKKQYPHANLFSAGMTSSKVLGSRAHLAIVDDPTTEQLARSDSQLKQQKDWVQNTLMTRLIPEIGRIFVIMTRWHNNDLADLLMNKLNFEVVHLPALGDEDGAYIDYMPPLITEKMLATVDNPELLSSINPEDPLKSLPQYLQDDYYERVEKLFSEHDGTGRLVKTEWSSANRRPCVRKYYREDTNPSVWPEYFTEQTFKSFLATYGTVRFNLLYQGDPTGMAGDIFRREWFRYYGYGKDYSDNETEIKKVPEGSTYYMSVDPAISQKTSADFFVIAVMAKDPDGNIYVVDILRDRLEAPAQKKAVRDMFTKYPQTLWVLVESIAYQQSLFQELLHDGIPCRKYVPTAGKDKELRARSASTFFEAGKVHLPTSAKWLTAFEDELTSFPKGAKDDQVDAVSSLLEELAISSSLKPVTFQVGFG